MGLEAKMIITLTHISRRVCNRDLYRKARILDRSIFGLVILLWIKLNPDIKGISIYFAI